MSAKLTTLLEERASVWEEMKTHLDAADAEGRGAYDKAEQRFDTLSEEIEKLERHANNEQKLSKVDRSKIVNLDHHEDEDRDETDQDVAYREAFESYVVRGMADLNNEQRNLLRLGWQGDTRAAGVGTGSAGGYLVPQGFRADIIERQKQYGAVQAVATVLDTQTGNPLPWPTNDDTGNVGALLAENTQASEQDVTIGTAQLGAYKYTSKIVRVSLEFLQDVDWMDAEAFLQRKFSERLGRIHNQHFTTGTGSSQPQGIVTGATSGVTAASTTAITSDELLDLIHSVDPAYRTSRAKFMLSDTALKGVRKLKASGTGEYLFQPSAQAGTPSTLFGSEYIVNQDMAVPATGVKSVLYGDFEAGYVIRLVKAFELIRMNERYADYGQVGFVAFDRADGLVQDSYAYRALTQA
jgi:HK97 family phage major capsid protein